MKDTTNILGHVELCNMSFSYGRKEVLKNVSFSLPAGEFLAIIGPNGGGKSTLLKIILGLVKPKCGAVSVCGATPEDVRFKMGYVPQDVSTGREMPISARMVVACGCLRRPGPRFLGRAEKSMVLGAMEMMGVADLGDANMKELSQGQRQRVLIARAMVSGPDILLLDEPTASVDGATQKALFDILSGMRCTRIMVSHDLMALTSHAGAVLCVNQYAHYHPGSEITDDTFRLAYGDCDVDLIAHGIPHRVFKRHTPGERT